MRVRRKILFPLFISFSLIRYPFPASFYYLSAFVFSFLRFPRYAVSITRLIVLPRCSQLTFTIRNPFSQRHGQSNCNIPRHLAGPSSHRGSSRMRNFCLCGTRCIDISATGDTFSTLSRQRKSVDENREDYRQNYS